MNSSTCLGDRFHRYLNDAQKVLLRFGEADRSTKDPWPWRLKNHFREAGAEAAERSIFSLLALVLLERGVSESNLEGCSGTTGTF